MEGLGACGQLCVSLFIALLAKRIVVPVFMRRPLCASETLGLWPLGPAAWADAACPECIPDGAAGRNTFPAIFGLRPVLAVRAVDLCFLVHVIQISPTQDLHRLDREPIAEMTSPFQRRFAADVRRAMWRRVQPLKKSLQLRVRRAVPQAPNV
jgi:hypothetical protein